MGNAKPILNSLKMNFETLGGLVREMPYSQRRLVVVTVARIMRMWFILRVINSLKALIVEWNYRGRREMIVKHTVELAGGLYLVAILNTQ